MDINKYIASGNLENYVLGLLSQQEQQEVERYALQYPEIQKEITAIEEALGIYSQANPIPMPDGLKDQILKKVSEVPPNPEQIKSSSSNNNFGNLKSLLLLAGVFALGALGYSYFLNQENNTLKTDLAQSNANLLNQQFVCDSIETERQNLQSQLLILKDTAYRRIILNGIPTKAPNAIAAIYFNENNKKTYLDTRSLPIPTGDKQFQLWAIVDGGAPIDMGVFDIPTDSSHFIEVPHIDNPVAFAVTLEPKGGSEGPTMEEMYVLGAII